MLRIAKSTRRSPAEILDQAERFFGEGGEGLAQTGRNECCISFAGAGGHVAVTLSEEGRERTVEIETREFEYPARRFLERL
ncbi:MAG: hypothetical protein EHM15_09515 [Desulfobacteraceae bacterium]|nr:MAG: hypothetical protein EHM15_09515 [Desulfobacteraceae bacterium]